MTRDEQRAATRVAIAAAASECLAAGGPAGVTTREVATRAGVAQSTVMYHFPTRDALLIDAVTHMAEVQSVGSDRAQALSELVSTSNPAERIDLLLDFAWREFASPEAMGAAQLWMAAWSEPRLVPVIRAIEERITVVFLEWVVPAAGSDLDSDLVLPVIDLVISTIRGLVVAVPVWGHDQVEARWAVIKPLIASSIEQQLIPRSRG